MSIPDPLEIVSLIPWNSPLSNGEDAIPPLPEDISDDLNDFLRLCFIKDPNSRPEAKVMSEHPWVKKMNPEIVCIGFSGANIS